MTTREGPPMSQPDEINTTVRQNVQTAVLTATEVAVALTEHITHRARLAQERAQDEARELQQRLRGEYAAAKPLLHRPWSETWWQRASAEQIGHSWQAAAAWARAGDPYAHQTLQTMRRELAERFHLPQPAPGLPAEELVTALKNALAGEADPAHLRERARTLREQADQADRTAEQLEDREQARGARYEAMEYRARAQQDLQAAAAWEAMADRQAMAAADVAAEGFPGRPSHRVAATSAAKAGGQDDRPIPARGAQSQVAAPERG
jgi:colicin import membrane protein